MDDRLASRGRGELDRQIATRIGDRAADGQHAGPVLRDGLKTASLLDLAFIYVSVNLVAATWSVGALTTTLFGLDLVGAFSALLAGNALAGVLLGLASAMGRSSAPQMFLSRYPLGMRGNRVPATLNAVADIGWFAANNASATLAASHVLPLVGVPDNLISKGLILASIALTGVYLAVGSFETLRRVQRWLVPLVLLTVLPITYYGLRDVDWSAASTAPAAGSGFNYWTMWLTAVGAVCFGYVATWSPYASDVSRFLKPSDASRPRWIVLVVAVAATISVTWLEMVGAAFATVAKGVDPAAHTASQGSILAVMALFFLTAGVVTNNAVNLISGSLSAKAVWRSGSRLAWTSAVAVLGTLLAAYSVFVSDVASTFHTFLVALLIWEAPWLGILITDYFVVRRGRYYVADLYGLNGRLPGWNRSGVTAYVAGLVVAALFSFTGKHELLGIPLYSPLMPQYFNGGDFSYVAGFLTAAGLYLTLARAARIFKVAAHSQTRGALPETEAGAAATFLPADRSHSERDARETAGALLPDGVQLGAAPREAELSRPLVTTVVAGLFLLALGTIYVGLDTWLTALAPAKGGAASGIAGEWAERLSTLPALLVGVLGLGGGLRLPRVVDRVIDLIDDRQLLQETGETFSQAQTLPALADFLTRHVVYRMELSRAWLVLPDDLRALWPELHQAAQPGPGAPLLATMARAPGAVVLSAQRQRSASDGPGPVARDPSFDPWIAAGARALIPLRGSASETAAEVSGATSDRLLGVWVVGEPRTGEALERRRLGLMQRISEAAILHLDHAHLAWEHQQALHLANDALERRVELRTAELERTNAALVAAGQAAEEARAAAEAASRVKSDFLATMSHELRTPLNAVIGFSEGLKEVAAEDGLEEYSSRLGKIEAAGRHLLVLVNNVLDLSKVEAGKMDLYLETFDVEALLRDVAGTVQPLVEQKGNTFRVTYESDLGTMHTDLTKVRQVLFNLLSNAGKFTVSGTVTLTAMRQNGHVLFRVADTGIGIAPEQIGRLFQPFTQVDSSTTRQYGGTGLGLTVSQHFCALLGGQITVESTPGSGSTFTATLPASAGNAP